MKNIKSKVKSEKNQKCPKPSLKFCLSHQQLRELKVIYDIYDRDGKSNVNNKEDDKISANKKIPQSPINPKDKNKVDKNDLQENKNGLYKQNARKVKSDGDNLVKKNSDNVSSNHIVSIKSSNINKPKLTLTKGLSNEKSNKVNHNQATASQNLNNSELSPKGNLVNNIGVNNYNSLSYLPGKTNTEKKDQAVKLNNNNNSKTIELLKCQNNSKSNYKLEPKANTDTLLMFS